MKPTILFIGLIVLLTQLSSISGGGIAGRLNSNPSRVLLQSSGNVSSPCPLDFDVLRRLVTGSKPPNLDTTTQCQYIRQGLRLVLSDYLKRTNLFLPPIDSAESCWRSYESLVDEFIPNFDIRRSCGFQTGWISQGCGNITTRSEFESTVSQSALNDVVANCNQSLQNGSPCAACTTSLSTLISSYLSNGSRSAGNLTDCADYGSIYAAAFANHLGPTDQGTLKCLFSLDFTNSGSKKNRNKIIIISVVVTVSVILVALLLIFSWVWFYHRRKEDTLLKKWKLSRVNSTSLGQSSGLDSISGSTNLVRFTLEEIRSVTQNFSRENIIGRGGYGNVYKGQLPDGSEVALKRFKNCSAAGDTVFTHEVEVIASVRHVNLVTLRGYCVATTPFEGHQRIIVCDLIKNGSLHDHLFGMFDRKLSWPIRQKIALGTARGLAYLHHGVQPGIIHRDIKASNILLDENFEPKVADFGLAKFTPEGLSHMTTRVAGTMGYVAPEYALYGQLTERSDVYSFGVVMLELLSGKKAIMAMNDDGNQQPLVVAEWAWSLVRNGRALDVIEEGMPELGPPEIMEKYVLIAVLCSHPQLYARPTMDQIVKMLEVDQGMMIPVPAIPDRPIPITAKLDDIQKSASSSGSGHLSSASGYQAYTLRKEFSDHHTPKEGEGEASYN
ncbi:OLC1v1007424C1 [Oldenlandia corymbosa var. corymbosa]|uniref:non-specific serine/threonine protein kinase n=1 Tax=Oldenlandia corymbosa var. corymbosa TaxID=529605 RepID=A0AAV1DJA2_OLDCO|nr:OLC1v1007424C1 [Oldenlandia corymbosa var. corymbosa]